MPIYEYRCGACGHKFEVMQKMSDQPMTDCPACGKAALSKLVSAAGFQLKGSGWYVTDFRDNKKKAKDDAGAGESKTSETGSTGESKTSEAGSAGNKAGSTDSAGKDKKDSKSTDTAKSK